MGGENMQVKRAAAGIYDAYRGVFLNRGVFVKAPPGFFAAYPSNFEQPPVGWEKLNVNLREIPSWDPKAGLLVPPAPKVEVPPPAPTPVAGATVSAPPAATEPVADTPAPTTAPESASAQPAASKAGIKARSRAVKIK